MQRGNWSAYSAKHSGCRISFSALAQDHYRIRRYRIKGQWTSGPITDLQSKVVLRTYWSLCDGYGWNRHSFCLNPEDV